MTIKDFESTESTDGSAATSCPEQSATFHSFAVTSFFSGLLGGLMSVCVLAALSHARVTRTEAFIQYFSPFLIPIPVILVVGTLSSAFSFGHHPAFLGDSCGPRGAYVAVTLMAFFWLATISFPFLLGRVNHTDDSLINSGSATKSALNSSTLMSTTCDLQQSFIQQQQKQIDEQRILIEQQQLQINHQLEVAAQLPHQLPNQVPDPTCSHSWTDLTPDHNQNGALASSASQMQHQSGHSSDQGLAAISASSSAPKQEHRRTSKPPPIKTDHSAQSVPSDAKAFEDRAVERTQSAGDSVQPVESMKVQTDSTFAGSYSLGMTSQNSQGMLMSDDGGSALGGRADAGRLIPTESTSTQNHSNEGRIRKKEVHSSGSPERPMTSQTRSWSVPSALPPKRCRRSSKNTLRSPTISQRVPSLQQIPTPQQVPSPSQRIPSPKHSEPACKRTSPKSETCSLIGRQDSSESAGQEAQIKLNSEIANRQESLDAMKELFLAKTIEEGGKRGSQSKRHSKRGWKSKRKASGEGHASGSKEGSNLSPGGETKSQRGSRRLSRRRS
jgi:hypothetical protein